MSREIGTINPVSNYRSISRSRHRSYGTYQRPVSLMSYLFSEIRDVFSIADVERAEPIKERERNARHTQLSYPFFDGHTAPPRK